MRPDRVVVKKAIEDAEGNLSRAALLLGCTRQTLYTWIYQHGLEKIAGVRMDKRDELDRRERKDTRGGKPNKTAVYSGPPCAPNLRVVAQQAAAVEQQIPATVKLPESLWKRVRTTAIWRGCTVGEIVKEALENALANEDAETSRGRKR